MSTDSENREIVRRKAQHLEICVNEREYDVEFGTAGFEHVRLVHRSLPEISELDIDTRTQFINTLIPIPLFISSMTGGSEAAYLVNKNLAIAAQKTGVPVGMGSIRILFEKPEVLPHFQLKRLAPDVPVFANLGSAQIRDLDPALVVELTKRLEVQAIAIHLNPGQELFQPGGERDFSGTMTALARFCETSALPVIVKETGFGIRPDEVKRLFEAGAAAVDVAGAGGTNWIAVESYRLDPEEIEAAREFDDWGNPTALILAALDLRKRNTSMSGRVLASGGLRSGMDLVKSIALGASACGFALPFVRAVSAEGVDGVVRLIRRFERVLRTAMVLTGSRDLAALRAAPMLLDAAFDHQVQSLRKVLGE